MRSVFPRALDVGTTVKQLATGWLPEGHGDISGALGMAEDTVEPD